MRGSSGGFGVNITAVDELSPSLKKISTELGGLKRQLQDLNKEDALGGKRSRDQGFAATIRKHLPEARKEIRELGHTAVETGRRLADAFEPLAKIAGISGGIAGALSIGALAESIDNLANAGAQLGRTSARIGVGTTALQQLGNAARLAGSSSDALTTGLGNLAGVLTSAALGQDSTAIAFFRQFHIAVRNSDGSIRSADSALGDLAEAISGIKNPIVQAQAATIAFGSAGADLLPFLRDGRKGLEEYSAEATKFGAVLSEQGVRNSHDFEKSQVELALAIKGVGNSITENVLPSITPMITGMAEWVAKNRDWIATGIGDAIKGVATWLKAVDWESVGAGVKNVASGFESMGHALGGILDVMKWGDAHPAIAGAVLGAVGGFRVAGPYGAAVGAGIGLGVGTALDPGTNPGNWATGPKQGRVDAPGDLKNNFGGIMNPLGQLRSYGTQTEGVHAIRDNLLKNYQGLTLRQMVSKWAPPGSNDTPLLISRAAQMMGMDPDAIPSMENPEIMRRLVSTFVANEHGGVLPPSLPQGAIDQALGFNRPPGPQGAIGGADLSRYATGNAAAGGASPWTGLDPEFAARIGAMAAAMPDNIRNKFSLISGYRSPERQAQVNPGVTNSHHSYGTAADTTWDAEVRAWIAANGARFGVGYPLAGDPAEGNHLEPLEGGRRTAAGQALSPLYGGGAPVLAGGAGGNPPASDALGGQDDTNHLITVQFANAPPGMRSRIDKADGPAAVTLRTHYGMDGSF